MEVTIDLLSESEIIRAFNESEALKDIKVTDYEVYVSGQPWNQCFWVKSINKGKIYYIKQSNNHYKPVKLAGTMQNQLLGILPVIKGENYEQIIQHYNDLDIIELYEYPNEIVDIEFNHKLDLLYNEGELAKTGRSFNGNIEYYYNGNKYIYFIVEYNQYIKDVYRTKGEKVWFRVDKVKWINLRKNKMLVCRNILNTGSFSNQKHFRKFSDTDIYITLSKMYQEMSTKVYNEDLLLTDKETITPLSYEILDDWDDMFDDHFLKKEENRFVYECFSTDYSHYLGAYLHYCRNYRSYYLYQDPSRKIGYSPVVDYDLIKKYCKVIENEFDYLKVKYGEYPSDKLGKKECKKLNEIIKDNPEPYETGKTYSINENFNNPDLKEFKLKKIKEYEINGKKYVRFDEKTWFRVEKLMWLVNKYKNKAYCYSTVFGGINYDFSNPTNLHNYIVKYFSHEIIPSKSKSIDRVNRMISRDLITQMIMSKENLNAEDLKIEGKSNLVLRR